jgi:hypothetical protein
MSGRKLRIIAEHTHQDHSNGTTGDDFLTVLAKTDLNAWVEATTSAWLNNAETTATPFKF